MGGPQCARGTSVESVGIYHHLISRVWRVMIDLTKLQISQEKGMPDPSIDRFKKVFILCFRLTKVAGRRQLENLRSKKPSLEVQQPKKTDRARRKTTTTWEAGTSIWTRGPQTVTPTRADLKTRTGLLIPDHDSRARWARGKVMNEDQEIRWEVRAIGKTPPSLCRLCV